ncbi:Gibberellin receptor GID1B [Striga hermonthica]|uniref:Gibberellin receptor GID1B n=1 Tax=Striga hermonthica TaxID=68872 RepID=A0A9N7NFZ9_STRHE|nr:Gibberellin receptor GID1B [Striga hermonthica]
MEEGVQRWAVNISNWKPSSHHFLAAMSVLPGHEHSSITRTGTEFPEKQRCAELTAGRTEVYSPRQWAWAHLRISEPDQPLSSTRPVPVIIFFHGRSFVHSSANSAIYDTFCRRLVAICRAAVVSVNYRRLLEHRCPAAYEDGWAALMWARSRPWLTSGSEMEEPKKVRAYLAAVN